MDDLPEIQASPEEMCCDLGVVYAFELCSCCCKGQDALPPHILFAIFTVSDRRPEDLSAAVPFDIDALELGWKRCQVDESGSSIFPFVSYSGI